MTTHPQPGSTRPPQALGQRQKKNRNLKERVARASDQAGERGPQIRRGATEARRCGA